MTLIVSIGAVARIAGLINYHDEKAHQYRQLGDAPRAGWHQQSAMLLRDIGKAAMQASSQHTGEATTICPLCDGFGTL